MFWYKIELFKLWLFRKFFTRYVSKFIKKNFNNHTEIEEIIGLSIRKWRLSFGITIVHSRQVRGDLIEIYFIEGKLLSWVDQSHAYPMILGIHDVSNKAQAGHLNLLAVSLKIFERNLKENIWPN